jgi:hypothetical protein
MPKMNKEGQQRLDMIS